MGLKDSSYSLLLSPGFQIILRYFLSHSLLCELKHFSSVTAINGYIHVNERVMCATYPAVLYLSF